LTAHSWHSSKREQRGQSHHQQESGVRRMHDEELMKLMMKMKLKLWIMNNLVRRSAI
jgi:hypothetical protein